MSRTALKVSLKVLSSLVLMLALLITSLNVFAASTHDPVSMQLFPDADKSGTLDTASDPTIVRTRYVDVNFRILEATEVGGAVLFDLFEDVVFTAVLDRLEAASLGGYSWIGHLRGVDHSQVVLVVAGGQIAGNITLPGGIYQIRYAGDGVHAIYEIDQSAFPVEAEPVPVELSDEAIASAESEPVADDGSMIDVMVVYTAAARTGVGGTVAMENLINLAMTETNQSYLNSGIAQQVNLVHTAEVSYTETGDIGVDLTRLQNPSDGYMDNVHTLRDTHMADLVSLFVENGGPYCGIAYFMTTVSPAFEDHGFSVVDTECATGYYSFGHEMGHNMGAGHDWYVYDDILPYTYSHAYLNVPDQWRTVMAYNSECAANGVNCTRLPYWSNPDVFYGGDPMGVPAGTSTACVEGDLNHPDCDADHRLTLNNTAFTVANFRDSSGNVGPLDYDSHLVDDDNLDNSSGDDDGIVDCGETIELYVDLFNQGADPAVSIVATISTSDPYITFLFNTSSNYPDIPGGSTGTNFDDFDFAVDPATPDGHIINFDLDITAANGGPWSDSFAVPVTCGVPEIEVAPPTFSVTLGVDEIHVETLTISNLGSAPLDFSITDVETSAPDMRFDGRSRQFDGPSPVSSDDMNAFPQGNNDPPPIGDPGPVLIIQDTLPWGYDSIQSILTTHGIVYDQVDSTQIPTVDLSPYDMVIIPSVQDDSFYTTWNANIGRFDAYVTSGGKLWQSTCNQPGVIEPLVLGGVGSADDIDSYNVILEPAHPWVAGVPDPISGGAASHDSFTSIYPGSIVVAAAQTSGNPTLVDYQYGTGRVLITGQTLEFAWQYGWDGAPILENSLVDMYTSGPSPDVLIIQDSLPWGYDAIQSTLTANGIAYDQVDSSQIPTVDLSPYEMIVIPSVQGQAFYTIWNANISRFEAYVNAGGKLWQSTCTYSATPIEPLVPGGVVSTSDADYYNVIVEPAHPWVAGVPNPMNGSFASHDSFANLYPGSIVVATAQSSGDPTLVDYLYGLGRILITGQTLEISWGLGWDGAPIVENSLLDLYAVSPSPDALWLSESPSMGTVGPGETVYVDVEFDATGLALGTYTADIIISNNDPDEDPVIVPVTMEVTTGVCPGGPNEDYFTTQDNEDNVFSGVGDCDMDIYLFNDDPLAPIEFNIFVPDPTGISALLILNWDVDETNGEIDEVYLNGNFAGTLTGADNTWSTTWLPVDPSWVVTGDNLVQILIDVGNPGNPTWAVNVDWGQLARPVGPATIRYVDILNPPPYNPGDTMQVEVEVDTTEVTQDLRTEVNLRDPNGVILDGDIIFHTTSGSIDDPILTNLVIPPSAIPGPGYDIQVLVYDFFTNILQDSDVVPFVVGGGDAELWIEPPSTEVPISGETTVDIVVTDVTDLYGVELELSFDPTIVEVVGAQVTPGSCPLPDFVVENIADNVAGTIRYAATSLSPSPPCVPGGVVASITFRGLAAGTSPVAFTSWLLADTNGLTIPVESVTDGEVIVLEIGTLEGFVELQGRTNHSGAEVCAWAGGFPISCEPTDPTGYYLIQLPQDTYDIVVEMERYLDGLKTGVFVPAGGVVTLPSVKLLGGDANEDDMINILDLALIGGRFGLSEGDPGWDPRADINNDLTVNILDVVLAATNFNKSSPVPWP
jgi:hypothetical protein